MDSSISDRLSRLSRTAEQLNSISNDLANVVTEFDEALKKLNLGVSAWVEIQTCSTAVRYLGYAKIGGTWGLALRERVGDSVSEWQFSSGPRWMRAVSVSRLPELLDRLEEEAQDTIKALQSRVQMGAEIVAAMKRV